MEDFADWFNPYSVEHMRAYEKLCNTGQWPEGFVPIGVEMPHMWITKIQAKMAEAWLQAIKNDNIGGGMPPYQE